MQSTIEISITGQTRPGTMRAASTSIATEATSLAIAQPIMLTALTTGDSAEIRLVAPRAINAPGTATTAAPYSADAAANSPATSHAARPASTPKAT